MAPKPEAEVRALSRLHNAEMRDRVDALVAAGLSIREARRRAVAESHDSRVAVLRGMIGDPAAAPGPVQGWTSPRSRRR